MKSASLTPEVLQVVRDKGTERPHAGEYNDFGEVGTYLCRLCGLALFRSTTKFHSGCGWPSFDNAIEDAVKLCPDADGLRDEIVCARCGGHLGHVFTGEGFTAKNIRHCVNSLSLDFVADTKVLDTEEAIFAAGCFWGVEYYFKKLLGILKTQVGYTGGQLKHPTYQHVCQGDSGHVEAIRVVYDPNKISYDEVAKYFFEIHDFTQADGQGPDIGEQYLSVAFYYNEAQLQALKGIIQHLKNMKYVVATHLHPVTTFWPAETYHQDYYQKQQKTPYCHRYKKLF